MIKDKQKEFALKLSVTQHAQVKEMINKVIEPLKTRTDYLEEGLADNERLCINQASTFSRLDIEFGEMKVGFETVKKRF